MHWVRAVVIPLIPLFLILPLTLTACATSKVARLERKADRIERSLENERGRILALPATDADRAARLNYLSQLRLTLSAANVSRATVRYVVEEPQQPIAYDVLDEVYSTIEWNIPLGPNDPGRKELPPQFSANELRLNLP